MPDDTFVMPVIVPETLNQIIMEIKGSDGHSYNVTGSGQGNLNTVLGALGTASFLGLNGGNILGRNGMCYPTCVDQVPVFAPQFSLVSVTQVSTGVYMATIQVQGIISYVPCNGGCGCTKTQPVSQTFTIPIASATAPTVTIAAGGTVNNVSASACQTCSRSFVSETPIAVTVSTAAA